MEAPQESRTTMASPNVTLDPRFRAGRKLIQSGQSNSSIEIFATLLEETRNQYGPSSLNASAPYYEYGNALFRSFCRREQEGVEKGNGDDNEHFLNKPEVTEKETEREENTNGDNKNGDHDDGANKNDEKDDDLELALEMMETAWSILDQFIETCRNGTIAHPNKPTNDDGSSTSTAAEPSSTNTPLPTSTNEYDSTPKDYDESYLPWAKEQLPRMLLGIGDVLTHQQMYGDAIDAYLRAIPHREEDVLPSSSENASVNGNEHLKQKKTRPTTVEFLKRQRELVEVYVLVAETLLKCPHGQDVVTHTDNTTATDRRKSSSSSLGEGAFKSNINENKSLVLVKGEERIDAAREYCDKAKKALQEAVFTMGKLASHDLGTEKEDICYLATMLMGVGTTLAEYDEESTMNGQGDDPVTKKSKLS